MLGEMLSSLLDVLLGSPYAVAAAVIAVLVTLVWLGVRFDRQQHEKCTVGVEDEVILFNNRFA